MISQSITPNIRYAPQKTIWHCICSFWGSSNGLSDFEEKTWHKQLSVFFLSPPVLNASGRRLAKPFLTTGRQTWGMTWSNIGLNTRHILTFDFLNTSIYLSPLHVPIIYMQMHSWTSFWLTCVQMMFTLSSNCAQITFKYVQVAQELRTKSSSESALWKVVPDNSSCPTFQEFTFSDLDRKGCPRGLGVP